MPRITAEIVTIGVELLKGSVLNTNARFLGKELTESGFQIEAQVTCGDSLAAIEECLALALARADLIILSGGLGPTPDDVTREAVAQFFKMPLVFSKSQFASIQKHYRRHGFKSIPDQVRKEAFYPENAVPLLNRFGIALGFYVRCGNRLIVVLPGVPSELEKMYHNEVRPLLKRFFKKMVKRPALVAKTVGMSEPEVMQRLGKDFFKEPFDFGIYPETGEVSLRMYAERTGVLQRLKSKIKKRLKPALYALEDVTLAEKVGQLLARKKHTVAAAESCTGGQLAAEITRIPGASRYFKGGVTAYDNAVKESFGVGRALLKTKGAVSKETAAALACGAREVMRADYGLGITGIAGPTGGSSKKPVGLVFIALSSARGTQVRKYLFWGDRSQVQAKASKKALELLWRRLRGVS